MRQNQTLGGYYSLSPYVPAKRQRQQSDDLLHPPPGDMFQQMKHASHPDIIKRLKRAHGHLAAVITMMEEGRPCVDLAQQLHAVESAITNAKRELIQDHMEHCIGDSVSTDGEAASAALAEFKTLAKYL